MPASLAPRLKGNVVAVRAQGIFRPAAAAAAAVRQHPATHGPSGARRRGTRLRCEK